MKDTFFEIEKQLEMLENMYNYSTSEYRIEPLLKMFHQNELFISEYRTNFIWNNYKKSRFIESLLLGMPALPMFICNREDGLFELIDGAQRLLAIDQFVNENLKLTELEKLTFLNGLGFMDLSFFRRQKFMLINIRFQVSIHNISSETKKDIFDRLNTNKTRPNL
ncbi:MAG: hypothetical protein EAZ97_11930 [Bacteroidetes bacterium]|nr:MAG: hypothetical protein EAZ97_11930 [Bacteroidota bacterium]